MGVYIKGMEMPKSCYKCPMRRRDGMDIVCPLAHERFSVADVNILDYRLNNCPLVPVPPHGRLIDADALRTLYEKWHSEEQLGVDIDACHVPIPVIRQNIDDAPTIIPASFENLQKNERYSQDNPAEEGE